MTVTKRRPGRSETLERRGERDACVAGGGIDLKWEKVQARTRKQ